MRQTLRSKSTVDRFPQCDRLYTANLQKTSFHNATDYTQQIYRRRHILHSKSTEDKFPQYDRFYIANSIQETLYVSSYQVFLTVLYTLEMYMNVGNIK